MTDLPEIHIDPDHPVDVEAVMRQIRSYIITHRNAAGPVSDMEPPPSDGRLGAAFYEQLYHAALIHDQLSSSINVIPSRVPIVGRFVTLARRQFHELVVYYVNQLAQKQIVFNRNILGAVNRLVEEIEQLSPAEIAALQQDLETLRQQMTARGKQQ